MKTKYAVEILIALILLGLSPLSGQTTQNPPELIEKIRRELINSNTVHLGSQEFRIPTALAKTGYWDDALQMTKKVSPINTAYVLSHLSLTAAGFADSERTEQIIKDTLNQTVFEEYGDLAIITLGNLAKAASRIDQPEQVIQLLDHMMRIIESSPINEIAMIYTLPEAYSDIAIALNDDKEKSFFITCLDELSELAKERRLRGEYKMDIALARIAIAFAEIGEIAKSRDTVNELHYEFHKVVMG